MVSLHYHHIQQGGLSSLGGGIHIHLRLRRDIHTHRNVPARQELQLGMGGWGEGWSIKLHQEHYFLSPPTSIECIEPQPQEELDHYY